MTRNQAFRHAARLANKRGREYVVAIFAGCYDVFSLGYAQEIGITESELIAIVEPR